MLALVEANFSPKSIEFYILLPRAYFGFAQ